MKPISNLPGVEDNAVKLIAIDMLVPFSKHAFTLYQGERLDDMVESIKKNGVIVPIIARTIEGIDNDASEYTESSPEFEILNRSKDSNKRIKSYSRLSSKLEKKTNLKEQMAISSYITCAAPYNGLLRGTSLPETTEEKQSLEKEIKTLSKVLHNNPLEHNLTTHRGVDDVFLLKLLQDNNFTEALKGKDRGEVNHEWIENNMEEFNKRMSGVVYSDPGFSSSTTQRDFAEMWAKRSGRYFMKKALKKRLKNGMIKPKEYQQRKAEL